MTTKDIFSYLSYKIYINDYLKALPAGGHGYRTKFAEACGCRLSYVTEVLNRQANFSLEQAEALNDLLGHTHEESDYFLLLINYERAGSHALSKRLRSQIEKMREKRLVLKDRVEVKTKLSVEDQSTYYSSWHYAAIHMLVSLEGLQTREALKEYLHLPKERVLEVLDFLVQSNLLKYEKGRYVVGMGKIFLGSDSPNIIKHHTNWRLRAIEALDCGIKTDLHYSSVVSLRKEDVSVAKEVLVKAIEDVRRIVRDSPRDEVVQVVAMDFFKI